MKFIKALLLLSTLSFMGSANAALVGIGDNISATFEGTPAALGANQTLTLATKGISAINEVGVHSYDFAEIFSVSVASDLNSVSLQDSTGSNSIFTEGVIAILDGGLNVLDFASVDLTPGGGDTTLGYLLEAVSSPYYVAFIGTLDRSKFNVECLPDGGIGGICTGAATTGGTANYILEISSVPVPAAVWLFGSAMIGVLGLRRKSAAVAAA